MRRHIYRFGILLFGLLCFSTTAIAQEWQLVMEITVTNDGKRMDGATVEVRKGGTLVKTYKTDSRGDIDVPLDPDGDYEIAVTGNGMVKKNIAINTKGVPPEDLKGEYYFPAEVDIFPKLEGLNYKVLDEPIGKIGYDPDNQSFDADLAYTKQRKAALDKLQADYLAQKAKEAELAEQKQKEYDAAIKAADKAFNDEKWVEAEKEYKRAAELKPIETYPSFQLAELETKLIKLREATKNYNEAIKLADAAATAKDYQRAVTEYKRAASIKPDENYPQEKVEEMQGLLAQQVKNEQSYLAAIERGDNALKISDLNTAKEAFEEAAKVKPEETYPKNKLAEINDILGKKEAKEEEYQAAVKAGDDALAAKNYDEAKASYQKALGVKPAESYPQAQIEKVDALIVEAAKEQQEYLAAVERADQALGEKQLEVALSAYQEAGGIKPEEEYPKNKIKEVEAMIAKQAENEQAYKDKIEEGDKAFSDESFEAAKTAFQAASQLKPKESYPQSKLQEIDGILAAQAKADQEYQAAIDAGDQALAAEDFALAKEKYNAAQSIKPEESYPKEKLAEIGTILVKMEENQAAYDEAIKKGDEALAADDLTKATQFFTEAKGLNPEESYPQQKLTEIEGILKEREAAEQEYKNAIAAADQALENNELEKALADYQKAAGLKPDDTYPKGQITKVEGMLAEAAQEEEDYLAAVERGNTALGEEKLDAALAAFKEAQGIRPDESLPTEKIAEIEAKLAEAEAAQAEYKEAIATADQAFQAEKYVEAKTAYEAALKIKDEQYPKDQILAADEKLEAIAAEAAAAEKLEADYEAALAEAQLKLDGEEYQAALTAYKKAAELRPEETLPQERITEIENTLAEIKAKEEKEARQAELKEKYDQKIAEADQAFEKGELKTARTLYQESLGLIAGEAYPQTKIDEINSTLADAAEQDELYNEAIAAAEALAEEEEWKASKAKFEEAASIKPDEPFVLKKISEIDNKLDQIAAEEAAMRLANQKQEALDQEYAEAMTAADELAANSKWEAAKAKYEEALEIKDEQLPKDKILEMEAKIKEEAAQIAAEEAQKIDEEYQALIGEADAFFSANELEDARLKYKAAIEVKNEQYPKDQLLAIREKEKSLDAEAEQAKLDAEYQAVLAEADALFEENDIEKAGAKYREALQLKEESYPKEQLKLIDARLAKMAEAQAAKAAKAELEAQYTQVITDADQAFESKDYQTAKAKYEEAIGLKEGDPYPSNQLQKIEELTKLQSQEERYNELLTTADQALEAKEYTKAKGKYEEAMALNAEDSYPQEQIDKVNELLAAEAAKAEEMRLQKQKEAQRDADYQAAIADGDKLFSNEEYQSAIAKYELAQSLREDKTYPAEQIDRINQIMDKAELDAANKAKENEERERRYLEIIALGNASFKEADYNMAKRQYEAALAMKPGELYPKNKIKEINSILNGEEEEEVVEEKSEPIAIQKGPKSTVDGSAEDEIDRMYAEMKTKQEAERGSEIEEKREMLDAMREEDTKREEAKRQNAIERIENISISMRDQQQGSDELNIQNYETVKRNTRENEERRKELSKEAERRRNNNLVDNEARAEADANFIKEKNEEVSTTKRIDLEKREQAQIDFRKEHKEEQRKRTYQEGDNVLMKEEAVRNFSIAKTEENLNKNTGDLEQRQKDYQEAMQNNQSEQNKRTRLEKDKIELQQKEIRTYNQERSDDYMDGYEKVKAEIKAKEDFEDNNQSSADQRREKEQQQIDNKADDIREEQQEGNTKPNDNYIEVVEKTEALESSRQSMQSEAEKKRQAAKDKEYYEGEAKQREDAEAANYSQGVTEKIIENPNGSTTIRRIKVDGTQVDVYEKTLFTYGNIHYTKNGQAITKEMWDSNSK